MKKLGVLLAFSGTMLLQNVFAQSDSNLKLSDNFPATGEKITVTYNPAGTRLEGKSDLNAAVYFIDNKDNPVADIDLKLNGKLLKGDFTVPVLAKAFFVKLSEGETVDDNNEKGYVYLVYKNSKPVSGAYASKAYVIGSGLGSSFANIKTNAKEALVLYQQEFTDNPQSEKEYQTNYYNFLATDKNPESAGVLNQKVENLIKSNNEKDLTLAANLLRRTKKPARADSLMAVLKTKFPNGDVAKNEMVIAFNKETDLAKKEVLYQEFIKKYPENNTDKRSIPDNLRTQLASAYLQKNNIAEYHRWANQIKNKTNLASTLNNLSFEWAKKGEHLEDAAMLSKESLDIMKQKMANPSTQSYASPKMMKESYAYNYSTYADTYAFILFKQNKFKEALSYETPVYETSKGLDAEVNEHYALILKAAGEDQKAKTVIEDAIKAGKSSEPMHAALKTIYVKGKGSDTSYDSYFASLKNAASVAARTALAKEMVNKPAPLFTLKDTSGNLVSLASLKGKVIVVDFWATWCGPCKASFPGMQMAVNKYKNDPNVKFLFIDTWESGENYLPGVKKFIADNHYTFDVLMDEKGDDGRQSKVVSAFEVRGIPTKFVLDKNGNIRFIKIGFSGSAESIKDEVSAMIEMATNPDITKGEKVTMLK